MVQIEKYPLTFGIAWLHIGKKVQLGAKSSDCRTEG
jgi:hypothetical protein